MKEKAIILDEKTLRKIISSDKIIYSDLPIKCSNVKPGDRLWVRERWSPPYDLRDCLPRELPTDTLIHYWADGDPDSGDWSVPKSSTYMPKWASRLSLIVVKTFGDVVIMFGVEKKEEQNE